VRRNDSDDPTGAWRQNGLDFLRFLLLPPHYCLA
jgi:hypothetical protein